MFDDTRKYNTTTSQFLIKVTHRWVSWKTRFEAYCSTPITLTVNFKNESMWLEQSPSDANSWGGHWSPSILLIFSNHHLQCKYIMHGHHRLQCKCIMHGHHRLQCEYIIHGHHRLQYKYIMHGHHRLQCEYIIHGHHRLHCVCLLSVLLERHLNRSEHKTWKRCSYFQNKIYI